SAPYDFPGFHFIFRTHVRDHSQTHVAPDLTLRAKPVRRIDSGDNEGRPNRSQLGDRSQQTHRSMCPALEQHRLFRGLSQRPYLVQWLVEPWGALLKSRLGQLLQPLLTLFGLINGPGWGWAASSPVN